VRKKELDFSRNPDKSGVEGKTIAPGFSIWGIATDSPPYTTNEPNPLCEFLSPFS
jgi:hypothetical protein